MTEAILTFLSVVAVSLVSLVGLVAISVHERQLRRIAAFFVSFAVGALLGDVFIHLIPESFAVRPRSALIPSLLVIGGMIVFFVVEKLLRHKHGVLHAEHHGRETVRHPELAGINVLGDAIHNFIDGVLIGASYLVNVTLGVSTTLAVVLHEIPQELGDFGILVHSGLGVRKAVLLNLASASVAIVGAAIALLAGAVAQETVTTFLIPVAAGGFVYIAAANLIPELQHDRTIRALIVQTTLILAGVTVMALLTLLE